MNKDESRRPQPESNKAPSAEGAPADSRNVEKQETSQVDELQELTQQLADTKDKYVRTVAEMENIRRRMDRERGDLVKFALESILKDMLPALDSLEKALPESESGEGKVPPPAEAGYFTGMMMVKKQLVEVLRKHGLEAIHAKGAVFDPNLHQAIQRVESNDVDQDVVGDEYAKGYTLHGRLLRPAMVSVLSPSGS